MSDIIHHGNEYLARRDAWYGRSVTCTRCNYTFEITEKTSFQHTTGTGSVGYFLLTIFNAQNVKILGIR